MRISKFILSHKNQGLILLFTVSSHLIVFIYQSRLCLLVCMQNWLRVKQRLYSPLVSAGYGGGN